MKKEIPGLPNLWGTLQGQVARVLGPGYVAWGVHGVHRTTQEVAYFVTMKRVGDELDKGARFVRFERALEILERWPSLGEGDPDAAALVLGDAMQEGDPAHDVLRVI